MKEDIRVELTAAPPIAELAAQWTELEARAGAGFFLSWTWIGSWLRSLPAGLKPRLLRAQRHGRTVGLALLVPAADRTLPLLGGQALWLHATGRDEFDQIAIEHNGLLTDAAEPGAQAAMLAHLCGQLRPWRRITLPHLGPDGVALPRQLPARTLGRSVEQSSWVVDLAAVRGAPSGYLGMLDAKTRYAVRRSRAAAEALGPVELTVAATLADAQRAMDDLRRLHALRWNARGGGSSFLAPFTQRFHAELLPAAFARGEIQVLSVHVGGRPLGHLYSFVRDGRISFYQSGIDYEMLGPKMSPGLLVLALAIEHNAALGHRHFDLLGGAGHYKKALATHTETLRTLVIERSGVRRSLEAGLRSHVVPLLQRASGDPLHWRAWLRKWTMRAALALSLPVLALVVDGCSECSAAPAEATQTASTP
ncbi:GNAT family N-acetyltransferase [Piscinibacter sp.]|uniref:GNAT family N-acetyltransferase n=1 Tax=Piscinibacter sp. TaxID=1903157 RepID=UPI0039E6664E